MKNNNQFDDKWAFYEQNSSTHHWLVAISRNDIVYLDPWAINISTNKPCDSCNQGWSAKIVDLLPKKWTDTDSGLNRSHEWLKFQQGNIK